MMTFLLIATVTVLSYGMSYYIGQGAALAIGFVTNIIIVLVALVRANRSRR